MARSGRIQYGNRPGRPAGPGGPVFLKLHRTRCTVVPVVSVSWTDGISFALVGQTALVEQMIVTHNIL